MNWIRDFVDIPDDISPVELAERFTITCAEVERVEPIDVQARGVVCAEITNIERLTESTRSVSLNIGDGRQIESVTSAPNLTVGDRVVFAPPGASVKVLGEIVDTTVSGRASSGMILPGDAIGIALAAREAIFLPDNVEPGTLLESALFDDWVIEVDNHSINHRPDLWGHYGLAREFAAMLGKELIPYPVVHLNEVHDASLPELPIQIDDPDQCPRYSGVVFNRVDTRPAPLWMQLRLGHVGLRPIDCLVDLTNYIMYELGQPMHAFDGDNVDRIEVGTVKEGTQFTTLDKVKRTLPEGALMILSHRKPVALAGIMGGAETEISDGTQTLLLESANFNPYTVRRCAGLLGHRTDASARFEKSLDPANTMLAIQRFLYLAKPEFPHLTLATQISDAFPKPAPNISVTIDPAYVARFLGHPVTPDEIREILTKLEFGVKDEGDRMRIDVPSFRATRDIEIEADIIEEVARFAGLNNIQPAFPEVSVRALEPNPLQQLERRTLRCFTAGLGMNEIYNYLWYDNTWWASLGFDPDDSITLRNPAADGMDRLRQTLIPGMLAAGVRNRHYLSTFRLVELGSVFPRSNGENVERRRLGVLLGLRDKSAEDRLLADVKGAVESWAMHVLGRPVAFKSTEANAKIPWEHPYKTAGVVVAGDTVGRVGAVSLEFRRRMDEHLAAWALAWAELELDALAAAPVPKEKLESVPAFPEVDLDFSVLVPSDRHYAGFAEDLGSYSAPLLRRMTFVDCYEGKSLPPGTRAITIRARLGDKTRTLEEPDLNQFRELFERHLAKLGMELRKA